MIRALISGDAPTGATPNKLLLLGFNHDNLEEFRTTGTPIAFNLAKYGYPDLSLAICFGASDEKMVEDIRENLGVDMPNDIPGDEPVTSERISE